MTSAKRSSPGEPSDEDAAYERLFGSPDRQAAGLARFMHLRARASEAFVAAQVDAIRAGEGFWRLKGDVPHDSWTRNAGEEWLELEMVNDPQLAGLVVQVRIAPTSEGLAATGLHLERDQRPLSARDLRRLKLRPLMDGFLAGYGELLREQGAPATRPSRPGRRGHNEEHWRDIYVRWKRNKARHPHRYIKAMREEWPLNDRPPESTVRRWVKQVEAKVERGELP